MSNGFGYSDLPSADLRDAIDGLRPCDSVSYVNIDRDFPDYDGGAIAWPPAGVSFFPAIENEASGPPAAQVLDDGGMLQ